MANLRAASRYIKSLLDLAIEQKVLEDVHKDMVFFARVYEENKPFSLMLRSPVIPHDKKREILARIFKGKVNNLTMSFFDIITKKNREPLLGAIAKEFHNAYNDYQGIGKATVISAVPLDEKLRSEFENLVRKYSEKKQIELVERIDPEMIGGFILNVGDRQIDASIKNKIKALKVKFSQNPYIKEL